MSHSCPDLKPKRKQLCHLCFFQHSQPSFYQNTRFLMIFSNFDSLDSHFQRLIIHSCISKSKKHFAQLTVIYIMNFPKIRFGTDSKNLKFQHRLISPKLVLAFLFVYLGNIQPCSCARQTFAGIWSVVSGQEGRRIKSNVLWKQVGNLNDIIYSNILTFLMYYIFLTFYSL